MSKFNVGIDIGGTSIKFGLFDESDKLLYKWSIDTDTSDEGKKIVPEVSDSLLHFFSEKEIRLEDLLSIGIDIPGPAIHGDKVLKAVNLNWKEEFNIAKLMKSCLKNDKVYIYALNDANAAAYGEYVYGAGKNYKTEFMATLGTGIGGALVFDDKIIEGMHGGAGEIGHVKVFDKYELRCNCGGIGCLETIAARKGIISLAKKNIASKKYKSSLNDRENLDDLDVKEICDLAKMGDELCDETIKEAMRYVGKAISYVSEIVEPECVIIGGGIAKAGDIILDYIKDGYDRFSTMTTVKPFFGLAKLQNEAGIYGAMLVAKKMRNESCM